MVGEAQLVSCLPGAASWSSGLRSPVSSDPSAHPWCLRVCLPPSFPFYPLPPLPQTHLMVSPSSSGRWVSTEGLGSRALTAGAEG